ncbi:MAG: hypothetical protein ACPG4N_08425 [Gammaproteobacteria bacterium]
MSAKYYVVLINQGSKLSPENLSLQFQNILKVSPETAEKLVANPYTVVQRNADLEKAERVAKRVEQTGCAYQIIEEGKKFVPPDVDGSSADDDSDTTMFF